MGHSELLDWVTFYQVEPFGQIREEQRAGRIVSAIANSRHNQKKRPRPYKAEDFMAKYEEMKVKAKEKPTPGQLLQKAKMITAMHNNGGKRTR